MAPRKVLSLVYSCLGFMLYIPSAQSAHEIYNSDTYVTLLSVRQVSKMSVFDLWNATGIHCAKDGQFLRHDYIDRVNTSCIKVLEVYLFKSTGYIRIKYLTYLDNHLKGFSMSKPEFIEDTTISASYNEPDIPDAPFFINKDNFEFLWLNETINKMYAGWYYDRLNHLNSPKFFFNINGIPYTAGTDFSQVATDIQFMDVVLTPQACQVDVRNESYCPGPNVSSGVSEMKVASGSVIEIPCSIQSSFLVTTVAWEFNGNRIDISSNPSKYSINDSNLLIQDFKRSDNGIYTCHVEDPMNTGHGEDVTLTMIVMTSIMDCRQPRPDINNRLPSQTFLRWLLLIFGENIYRAFVRNGRVMFRLGAGHGKYVTLTMIGPPNLIIPTETYSLQKGNTMVLECQDNSYPALTEVFWVRNDLPIQVAGSLNYSGSTTDIPSLTIVKASHLDLGIYKCCATNTYQTSSTACGKHLMVTGDPHIRIENTLYEVYPGDNVEVNCSFKSYPEAIDVYWTKDGNRLLTNDLSYSNFSGNPSLSITGLTLIDRGNYSCCVKNSISTRCGKPVLLGGKPNVTVQDTSLNGTRNTDITIQCSVEAFPVPVNVSWNITVFGSETNYDSSPSTKYDIVPVDGASLVVKSLGFQDTGDYLCIAENLFGSSFSSVVSLVVYGVLATAPTTNYSIVYGESVELNCTIKYEPDLHSVTWTFANDSWSHIVGTSNPVKYSGSSINTPHLTIQNVDFTDAGRYKCMGSNGYETDSSSDEIILNIRGGLPTVNVVQFYVIANTSQQVTLTCTYDGEPSVNLVKWYKNSNGIVTEISRLLSTPSLSFNNLAMSDAGNYTCCAINAVGQTMSSTITLQVNQAQEMCPCSCEYKDRLDYWATQGTPNYTMEEWREVLAPVLQEMKKNLTVDVANLSATIRKRTSAPDDRESSRSMGVLGIVLISLVGASFVFIDIASIKRHCSTVKDAVTYR